MEEDKKEQNNESVEKEESAQGGSGETLKHEGTENTKTQKHENNETQKQAQTSDGVGQGEEIEKLRNEEIEEKETETKVEAKEDVDSTDKNEKKDTKTKVIYPEVIPGANVKIHQKIREKKGKEEKERIQVFEGIVLARKGGSNTGATISVKKICKGGFEVKKIYPLHSPVIAKIEVVRQAKVRQAKLGFLKRGYKKKLKYKNQEIKKTIKQ